MQAPPLSVPRGELIDGKHGGLSVWAWPRADLQYAVGVDTSAGIRGGDYSAACVVEVHSCEQVAEMHGLFEANAWGYACSRLGWLYNTAPLAFETHPSPHGLVAHDAALRYGYTNLWRQRKWDSHEHQFVTRKGWVRTPKDTEGLLFGRIRQALGERCPIHSERLLDELVAFQLGETGKAESAEHDDCVIAYAIALLVRDECFTRGEVKIPDTRPRDLSEIYWRAKERGATRLAQPERLCDGC